jgi:hypothetical protein
MIRKAPELAVDPGAPDDEDDDEDADDGDGDAVVDADAGVTSTSTQRFCPSKASSYVSG